MFRFKRTVSALALGLCLAGGVSLAPGLFAPVAQAQSSAEARFRSMLDMLGVPADLITWSSVEESGDDLVARGVVVDVAKFNLGFTTFPLGDWEISELETDGDHVTRMQSRFTNVSVNVGELMTTGQKIGQSQGEAASMGMGIAMFAGYLQGLGYQTLDMSIGWNYDIDLDDETMQGSFEIDVKDALKLAVGADVTGVTRAYLDWAKQNLAKMYLDRSADAMAQMQKEAQDPTSPVAKLGYRTFSVTFDDQGLMPKLEPQLAMARGSVLGTNPDGSAKTEVTDEDVRKAAAEMAGQSGLSAEKLEPVIRAIYNFVLKPDVLHLAVTFDPSVSYGEVMASTQPGADPAAKTDWNSRVSLEASN